jgi:hypothetical protein
MGLRSNPANISGNSHTERGESTFIATALKRSSTTFAWPVGFCVCIATTRSSRRASARVWVSGLLLRWPWPPSTTASALPLPLAFCRVPLSRPARPVPASRVARLSPRSPLPGPAPSAAEPVAPGIVPAMPGLAAATSPAPRSPGGTVPLRPRPWPAVLKPPPEGVRLVGRALRPIASSPALP